MEQHNTCETETNVAHKKAKNSNSKAASLLIEHLCNIIGQTCAYSRIQSYMFIEVSEIPFYAIRTDFSCKEEKKLSQKVFFFFFKKLQEKKK